MAAAPGAAEADVWATNFESSSYTTGQHIDGQAGWSDTDLHDSNVVKVSDYPNAAAFGFGAKALQISNFKTDSAFGGQTFTPSTGDEAGETTADNAGWSGGIRQSQFKARFRIGVADPTPPGSGEDRHVTISADRGDGARMSYLRFEDPVLVRITGSLFYDVDHEPGVVGSFTPPSRVPATSWEIHPITEIVLEP